jgi:AI-2 transport protein TqsA
MQGPVLRWLLGAGAVVVIVAGLRAAAPLLVPLLVAVFLSLVVFPLVAMLQRRKVPSWGAVSLAMLLVVGALVGPGLVVQSTAVQFAEAMPRYQERLAQMMVSAREHLGGYGLDVGEWGMVLDPDVLVNVVGFTVSGVAALLSNLLLVLLLTMFILLETAAFTRKLRRARRLGEGEADYLSAVPGDVLRYLWIKTLVSLMTGLLIGLWVWALGVDFAILWGFLAFLLNYIPNFGSVLAAIPAVLLAALQFGPGWAALVAAGYVVVNLVLGNILEPLWMGRRLGLSPLVVLLSLLFWGWVFGPVGMLLSVPLTMVVKIVMENIPDLRWVAALLAGEEEKELPAPVQSS